MSHPSGIKIVSMMELYKIMEQHDGTFEEKFDFLEATLLNSDEYSVAEETNLKTKLKKLRYKFRGRWQLAKRRNDLFLNQNQNWLLGTADLPRAKNKDGRPKKSFIDLSERGKRKRTEQMRRTVDTEELRFAMGSKLRESGQLEASKLVHEIAASPTRANKFRRAYVDNLLNQRKEKLSLFKALAIFVDANLSRTQYEVIRTSDVNLFPCYSKLQAAKKDCYPMKEAIKVSATCAEVNLQDLLNHTALRLLTYLAEIIEQLHQSDGASFELILKWGCDGSQQNEYKQKFANDTDSDAQIFQSSMVPLRLTSGKNVVWQNPTPSSPRYCRPIRLRFAKETSKIIQEEVNYVQDQINNLQIINIGEHEVKFTMIMTMVDAKVCNAITSTLSTMRCYICGATSSTFNNLSVTKEIDPDTIKFGLSILHARIRLFETLLHLAYKLPVKKWQIRNETDKNLVNARKIEIQQKFKTEIGLIVDVPKQGYGNSNDGNSSRRFFKNDELSAEITGVDLHLIRRIKVILEAISSGYEIDVQKFEIYATETAKLYVDLYPWHPMTPTLHKILIHGSLIVQHALIPIGQLSEEAAEARNKHIRLFRLNHSRKFSREQCNTDVLNRLLLTSDPLISSMRKKVSKKSNSFLSETLELLLPAQAFEDEDEENAEAHTDFSDEG